MAYPEVLLGTASHEKAHPVERLFFVEHLGRTYAVMSHLAQGAWHDMCNATLDDSYWTAKLLEQHGQYMNRDLAAKLKLQGRAFDLRQGGWLE